MQRNRMAGTALIVSQVMMAVLMAVHPSHGGGPAVLAGFSMQDLVHGAALLATPLLGYGLVELARFQEWRRPAVMLALSFALLSLVAVLCAATVSGLVTSRAIEAVMAADASRQETLRGVISLSVWLNRGFAHVHLAYLSLAIILFSIGWRGSIKIRLYGLAAGFAVLAWQLSGTLSLHPHQVIVVVLLHGAWIVGGAITLFRHPESSEAQ